MLHHVLEAGLIDPSEIFIDGTHIKAAANNHKYKTVVIDQKAKFMSEQLEIEINFPAIAKMQLFAAVGIPEVWRYDGSSLLVYCLSKGRYDERTQSLCLPNIPLQLIETMLDRFLVQHGGSVRDRNVHMLKGAAAKMLPAFAIEKNVDLIVMGTVARSGAAGFVMGNTAERILDQIQCSVLALKPDDFVCPIKEK